LDTVIALRLLIFPSHALAIIAKQLRAQLLLISVSAAAVLAHLAPLGSSALFILHSCASLIVKLSPRQEILREMGNRKQTTGQC
jgi:hypothetical protein